MAEGEEHDFSVLLSCFLVYTAITEYLRAVLVLIFKYCIYCRQDTLVPG